MEGNWTAIVDFVKMKINWSAVADTSDGCGWKKVNQIKLWSVLPCSPCISSHTKRSHEFVGRDLVTMYKCISLWLIVLTIIMTFCVSHQKQLDNDPDSDSAANMLVTNDDAMRQHENGSTSDSTNLGEHETFSFFFVNDDAMLNGADCRRQFYCVCVRSR